MISFIEHNREMLLTKKLGLYLCHMAQDDEAAKEFNKAFPADLRKKAIAMGLFDGRFDFQRMNFVEKLFIKKIAKTYETIDHINHQVIESFARAF